MARGHAAPAAAGACVRASLLLCVVWMCEWDGTHLPSVSSSSFSPTTHPQHIYIHQTTPPKNRSRSCRPSWTGARAASASSARGGSRFVRWSLFVYMYIRGVYMRLEFLGW